MSDWPRELGKPGQVMAMRDGERVWVDPPRTATDVLRDEIQELRARVARLEAGQAQGSNVEP